MSVNLSSPLAEASLSALLTVTSHLTAKKVELKIGTSETDKLTNILDESISAEIRKSNNKVTSYFSGHLCRVIGEFDFKRRIIEYTRDLFRNASPIVISTLGTNLLQVGQGTKSFVDNQLNKLREQFETGKYFGKIPKYLNLMNIRKAFSLLVEELLSEEKLLRVHFLIGDMDCKGTVQKIDKVTIYDSRRWDFGEPDSFDHPSHPIRSLSEEFKSRSVMYEEFTDSNGHYIGYQRNSARAFVDVYAKDPYAAIDNALGLVSEALDALVFASSAGSDIGFKPQLPTFYQVVDRASRLNLYLIPICLN